MTKPTMVTDGEVQAVLDAVATHGTNTDCGRMVVRMATDRDVTLGLLCLLDVRFSVSSNVGLQRLLDATVRKVVQPEHYEHIPKAEEWLKEAHGE